MGGAAKEALECGRGGEAGDVASYLPAAAAADSSVGAEKDRGRRSPSPGSLLPGSPVSYFGGSPKRLSGVMGTGRQDMEMGPEAGRVEDPGRRVGGGARLGGDERRAQNEKGTRRRGKIIAEPGVKLARANEKKRWRGWIGSRGGIFSKRWRGKSGGQTLETRTLDWLSDYLLLEERKELRLTLMQEGVSERKRPVPLVFSQLAISFCSSMFEA